MRIVFTRGCGHHAPLFFLSSERFAHFPQEPEVTPGEEVELKWTAPDEEGLVKFMCEQNGFAEDRIRAGAKKLAKARQGATQGRLDGFFKVTKTQGGGVRSRTPGLWLTREVFPLPGPVSRQHPAEQQEEERRAGQGRERKEEVCGKTKVWKMKKKMLTEEKRAALCIYYHYFFYMYTTVLGRTLHYRKDVLQIEKAGQQTEDMDPSLPLTFAEAEKIFRELL